MMFGVGGAARGYSLEFVYASALLYNQLSNDPTPGGIDGAGAIPGWEMGMGGLYRDRNMLCRKAITTSIGRDSVEQIRGCQACTGKVNNGATDASSIRHVSDGTLITIPELQRKLNDYINRKWNIPSQ